MKATYLKFYCLILGLFLSLHSFGQTVDLNLNATMAKAYGTWKKDSQVSIVKFVNDESISSTGAVYKVFYLEDSEGNKVDILYKLDKCFNWRPNNIQELWDGAVVSNVLFHLKNYGYQHDLRREMEYDALDYIQRVKQYGLELDDPYLETYIYSLISKIVPNRMIDGRPGSINLLIEQNPNINACCFPNGTIVLNTGLLAALHSEAELVAILSHEIAHYVLDHSVQNIVTAINRQRRAEFWAAVATGVTAAAEGYMAATNDYYIPGAATYAVASLSTGIASAVIERLGMNYNHDQEKAADEFAVHALKLLGYDSNALATALERLKGDYIRERNYALYFDSYSHPSLISRIKEAGEPQIVQEREFEQMISFAVTNSALMKYSDRRFHQCLPLLSQNIENNVAIADDYLIKANCLLATNNTIESNTEVIELIEKAKELENNNINIYKAEIIATLRLNHKEKALELLDSYIDALSMYNLDNIKSNTYWDTVRQFVSSEDRWARQMKIKLKGM